MLTFLQVFLSGILFAYVALAGLKSVADVAAFQGGAPPPSWGHFLVLYMAAAVEAACLGLCVAATFSFVWFHPFVARLAGHGPPAALLAYGCLLAFLLVAVVVAYLSGMEVAAGVFFHRHASGSPAAAPPVPVATAAPTSDVGAGSP